jgi:hypothetical protein
MERKRKERRRKEGIIPQVWWHMSIIPATWDA